MNVQHAALLAQYYAHLSKIPRQLSRLLHKSIIRYSTAYTTKQEIEFAAKLIELSAPYLRELSIDFCSCFRNDKFLDNSTVFGYNSKFYALLRYVYIQLDANAPSDGYLQDFSAKYPLSTTECEAFYPLTSVLLSKCGQMRKLRVLTLINPPPEALDLTLPENVELLVLQNCSALGPLFERLKSVKSIVALSLSHCNIRGVEKEFFDFLRANCAAHAVYFAQNLYKYYGACARHTSVDEIAQHYTEMQLLSLRYRLDCTGIYLLDLQNCGIDARLGEQLFDVLKNGCNLQVFALKGNNIDLTLRRRDYELEAAAELSQAGSIARFMYSSFSEGFRKKPPAALLACLRYYSTYQAEQYELLEMRQHFMVRLMDTNTFIRKVWMDQSLSPCLREYIELKCKCNQTRLHDAIISTCTDADFCARDRSKLAACIEGRVCMKSCLTSLLEVPNPMRQKKAHSAKRSGKASISPQKQRYQPRISEKLQIPKRTIKKHYAANEDAIVKNIKLVKEYSSRTSFARDDSRISARSTKSNIYSSGARASQKAQKASTSRLTSSPVGSPSQSFQRSEKSSRSSSKSRPNASTFRVESTFVSDDAQSRARSATTADSTQKTKISVLKSREDALKLQELLKPFQQSQAQEEKAITEQPPDSQNQEMLQKIVDMLYDALVFSCDDDQTRAKQVFLNNYNKILEYCNYLVNDIHAGRLYMREVRAYLFSFIESYI